MGVITAGAAFLLGGSLVVQVLAPRCANGGGLPASERGATVARAEQLFGEAKALVAQRRYSSAHAKVVEAVGLLGRRRGSASTAEALMALAADFNRAGYFQESIYYLHWLVELAFSPSTSTKTESQIMLGELYEKLSRPDLALSHYNWALATARVRHQESSRRRALAGLVSAYSALGNLMMATMLLKELRKSERPGSELEAKILALLGGVYRARGQFEDARNMLEASLDLFRRCGAREDQIRLLVTLSDLEIALGHKPAALEHARAAVALAGEAVVGVDPRWRAWLALGRAERANADMRGALVSCFRAFALVEAQNVALTADQLKVSVLSERQRVYSELADLYAAAGRVDEAFRVAEHGRARAMLDLLGISPGARDNVTPAQRERLEATSNHLSKLNHQMLSQSLPDGKRATVEAAVRDATQRREEMEMNIQSNQLKRFTRPADVAMVRNKVLAPGELLAEFILGDSSSLLWLITDHSARCIQLPPRRKIENETAAFLKLIASRPSALHLERDISRQMSSAAALFDMLFAGAAVELDSAQALIIIPDGVLHHLPFETLVRGGQYAIERIDISYAPSASVLGVLRDAVSGSDAPGRKALLAFGDPEAGRKMKPISRRPRRWQRVSDQLGAGGLARLPNAAAEITAVAKLFPEGQCSIHLGTEATEEAFRRASGERYSTLHFATHAMIDESFPARSGVLLAADGGSLEDGLLDISEIGSLHLNCDLVVLNACSTARGKLAPGEGMLGLTRAFLFAGASSVAVTLWDVSDLAASSVVTSFYRNIVAGRSTRAALRQAKIEMIRGRGLSRHPHYWGSLIVVGAAR